MGQRLNQTEEVNLSAQNFMIVPEIIRRVHRYPPACGVVLSRKWREFGIYDRQHAQNPQCMTIPSG